MMIGSLLSASAFTIVDGDGLDGNSMATLIIDFSQTTVGGLPLDEFLNDTAQTEDFDYETRKYYADFIKRFNDRCSRIMLTRTEGKPLTLTVKILTVNRKGNEATCDYIFTDTASGKVLLTVNGRTREGRIGSFSNLVGDVVREAGGDFGGFLSKYLKKRMKKNKNTDPIYE